MQPLDQPAPSNRRWLLLFLAAIVILGAIRRHTPTPGTALRAPADRKPLPASSLTLLDGTPWTPTAHRGQVILINYWATWCEPCREEAPILSRLASQKSPRGFTVVGVSLDAGSNAIARVRQFAATYRLPYLIAFPAPAPLDTIGIMALPTSILLDRRGRVAITYVGAVDPGRITGDIDTLLGESGS